MKKNNHGGRRINSGRHKIENKRIALTLYVPMDILLSFGITFAANWKNRTIIENSPELENLREKIYDFLGEK